ncbi:MAG: hypothetical protein K0Q73_6868 [Paenibacillus sp.]|jgi:catechol 2,3-dioxygenase-like lactoylglutathione lyase family enzyme|nr:hypothetical protein [Paenibacillus sp.]
MPVQQIGGVFIPVSNLEKSITFYTETLGLVCRGIEDWGIDSRGATLFCNPHPQNAALLSLAEMKGSFQAYDHPIFNLKCSDVSEMHKSLKAIGCRVTELETWDSPWNLHVLFDIFDPDGHRINLIEMAPIAVTQSR